MNVRNRHRLGVPALVLVLSIGVLGATPGGTPVAKVETREPAESIAPADLTPAPYQREVARVVGDMLQRFHYKKQAIDDEVSRRWLDNYLDDLDYGHNVFLQSDVDEFRAKYGTTLDDDLRAREPRLDSAIAIYQRYRERLAERIQVAMKVAEGPIDLTNAEYYVPDRHELPWPATKAEADELWRQRVEEDLIEGLLDGRDTEEQVRSTLKKRYERWLKNAAERESVDVLELWLGALTTSYDPHSVWMKPTSSADFNIDITNSVEGIGAQLTVEDEYVVVENIVTGGPAFKDKRLKPKDRILAVAQGNEPPVDVVGMRLEKVVKLIRGPKGTEVRLTVQHADAEAGVTEVVTLVRDRVLLTESAAESRVEEHEGHKIGYVDLPSFYVDPSGRKTGSRASEDVRKQLEALKAQGVEGVVLDLRENGGGSLIEAIDVAGLFLPAGPIVQVRDRDGRIEALFDTDPSVAWSGPLVVLVDAHSASASEIVAGALQDYGRAVIVGDRSTHGKGTVQQVVGITPQLRSSYDEDVGGDLKFTVQKFYRVSGGSTQNKGVLSDVVLPSWLDGAEVHESDVPYALPWDRIPPAPHVRTGDLTAIVPELQARSKARVAASEEFADLIETVTERESLEEKNQLSLVLEERKKELEERKARLGASEDVPPEIDALPAEEREAALEKLRRERDFRLDEGIAVLKDLIALQQSGRAASTPPKPTK